MKTLSINTLFLFFCYFPLFLHCQDHLSFEIVERGTTITYSSLETKTYNSTGFFYVLNGDKGKLNGKGRRKIRELLTFHANLEALSTFKEYRNARLRGYLMFPPMIGGIILATAGLSKVVGDEFKWNGVVLLGTGAILYTGAVLFKFSNKNKLISKLKKTAILFNTKSQLTDVRISSPELWLGVNSQGFALSYSF